MTDREPKPTPDLVDSFHSMIAGHVDTEGVYPHVGLFSSADPEGGADILHMTMIDLRDTIQVYHLVHTWIELQGAVELVFGIDRYTKEDQGTEFADCITVAHWKRGAGWQYGVIDYKPATETEEAIVRAINWQNAWWSEALHNEHKACIHRLRPMKITVTNKDGRVIDSSEVGLEGLR